MTTNQAWLMHALFSAISNLRLSHHRGIALVCVDALLDLVKAYRVGSADVDQFTVLLETRNQGQQYLRRQTFLI